MGFGLGEAEEVDVGVSVLVTEFVTEPEVDVGDGVGGDAVAPPFGTSCGAAEVAIAAPKMIITIKNTP